MNGLGGLNKSPEGVVIGLVQLQLPVVVTKADLARQTERIVTMVGKARRNLGTMDLVVFPEYSLHGLSMDTNPEIMCRLDGPEVAAFKQACVDHKIWGCFSIMEFNPNGNPYNSGLIIDNNGEIKLYYRKFHPWIPVEPWEPGDIGIPVIEGPKGAKLALIICHDGMFPEMARECAYKGAEIMIRTAGYTAPIRESWRFTNQANSFQNLMVTANVCMCGSDGSFDSMGEGMIVNFDGSIIAHGTTGRADEIITAEVRPDLVREAANSLGRREQHLPALAPRLRRGERRRDGLPVYVHAGHGGGYVPAAVGGSGQGHGRDVVRFSAADTDVRENGEGGGVVRRAYPSGCHPRACGDPVRRGLSVLSSASLEYWVARLNRAMTTECVSAISRRIAPELCQKLPALFKQRAQGRPGARCTRGLACGLHKAKCTRAYRAAENTRPSLRNGFTAYAVISPETSSWLTPSLPFPLALLRQLDACNGRQDHTVLPYA